MTVEELAQEYGVALRARARLLAAYRDADDLTRRLQDDLLREASMLEQRYRQGLEASPEDEFKPLPHETYGEAEFQAALVGSEQ